MAGGLARYETLYGLLARHFERVTREGPTKWALDLSGGCESPQLRELHARPHRGPARPSPFAEWCRLESGGAFADWLHHPDRYILRERSRPIWLFLHVPCRKCAHCLRVRAARWRDRAREEMASAGRTWFCTFTLAPHEHHVALERARYRCGQQSLLFESLTPDQQFAALTAAISPAITRYLKRVRKQSGAPLRYLFVAERHKSGLPHFHALIHELSADRPVRKAVLREQWHLGFSQFKLAEGPGAANYVTKYLCKELCTRVRASLRYGRNEMRPSLVLGHTEVRVATCESIVDGEYAQTTDRGSLCGGTGGEVPDPFGKHSPNRLTKLDEHGVEANMRVSSLEEVPF